jgi:hypothetical protein
MKPAEDDPWDWLDALLLRTADELRAAGGDRGLIAAAFERFLDEGMPIIGEAEALYDPVQTLMERAGFDARQTDRGMRIFSTVAADRFLGGRPYPPDWPWHEVDPLTGESLI